MAGAAGGGLAAVAAAACSDAWQSGGGRVWAQAEHVGRPGACAAAKAADRPAGARQGGLGRVPHREAHVGRLLALRLWWRVRFKVRGLRERGALRHPGERVARPVRGIHHDPPTCGCSPSCQPWAARVCPPRTCTRITSFLTTPPPRSPSPVRPPCPTAHHRLAGPSDHPRLQVPRCGVRHVYVLARHHLLIDRCRRWERQRVSKRL